MDAWVDARERTLGTLTLVLGVLAWVLITLGTFGVALLYALIFFVAYCFAQSALVAHLRGTAVRLSPQQMPDLHDRFQQACQTLGVTRPPEAYVLHGDGAFNAFAARFLGRHFVVLLSDMVDAMDEHPEGVNFYIGHELGHIRRKHLTGAIWRWPVLWLPLLGAAYSRARERTCDLHGAACCTSAENAARAMAALAAGAKRWRTMDLAAYAGQAQQQTGFWASFHGLTSGYPWVSQRVARILSPQATFARRHPLAWLLAAVVPYAGRAGGGAGMLVLVAIIGVLAAVALPAYQDYTHRAQVVQTWQSAAPLRDAVTRYYVQHGEPPGSLAEAGAPAPAVLQAALDSETMVITVMTPSAGQLVMEPELNDRNEVSWSCRAGDGMRESALPALCRGGPDR